jgi:small subunit ribosomal protein S1
MKQVALNDIGTAEDLLKAIDESIKSYSKGQIVSGVVVQIDRQGVLVDIGDKSEAFIPKKEITTEKSFDLNESLQIGQIIEAAIAGRDEDGNYLLSFKEGKTTKVWDALEFKYNSSDIISGKIKKVVKGGLIVDIGVKAFLPGSQIDTDRVEDFSAYVDQQIDCIIIQFDRAKGSIVLSRKALLEKTLKEDRLIEFAKVAVGQIHDGKISGISDYGAFVKLGLLSGLIHKSKMGEMTPDSFTIGQDVRIEIIDIDFEKSRLSLLYRG